MTAADPFRFYREQHLHDGPVYYAPEDAVASWLELAEKVREELVRMGFAASVVADVDPYTLPFGARIWVHKIEPFGVTLDWSPPVTVSPEYREKVLNRDISGLFRYVVNAKGVIIRMLSDVLHEAGFKVLADHASGGDYNYRVLQAPQIPLA